MKIDWKAKLASRKFWAAIISLVTSLLVVFGVPDIQKEQITAVVAALGTLTAYIVGEGMVDVARIKKESGIKEEYHDIQRH